MTIKRLVIPFSNINCNLRCNTNFDWLVLNNIKPYDHKTFENEFHTRTSKSTNQNTASNYNKGNAKHGVSPRLKI